MGFHFLGFFFFLFLWHVEQNRGICKLCWVLVLRVVLSKMVLFSMDFRTDAYCFVMVASKWFSFVFCFKVEIVVFVVVVVVAMNISYYGSVRFEVYRSKIAMMMLCSIYLILLSCSKWLHNQRSCVNNLVSASNFFVMYLLGREKFV